MKELKLYKHHINDDCYLLGYNDKHITGILLSDGMYAKKSEFFTGWNSSIFKKCDNISSGNISITNKVGEVYLDKNDNPVMKCAYGGYILIYSMEEYEGSLEDLTTVDKVIIKVH